MYETPQVTPQVTLQVTPQVESLIKVANEIGATEMGRDFKLVDRLVEGLVVILLVVGR